MKSKAAVWGMWEDKVIKAFSFALLTQGRE